MIYKYKIITYFFLLFFAFSFGQMQHYNFKRELKGITSSWHELTLPNDIYEKTAPNLSDLRVFGITAKNDTIEAPYLLQLKNEKQVKTNINFKTINTSHNEKGHYFTLELEKQDVINELKLNFNQFNFDWKLALEGSNTQNDWFTIVDDYRILSIKNDNTFYEYTQVTFPNSSYRYFRILIKSPENPKLKLVEAHKIAIERGVFNEYAIKNMQIAEKPKEKSTSINIDLAEPVPVSYLKIDVNASFDYYRPISIQYVSDSVKTQNGYVYNYKTLSTGTLNSIENNSFSFENTIAKKLKINISNQDNQPLKINAVNVKGNVYTMAIRFTEPATYFLTYGNSKAYKPNYDIERFALKTPEPMPGLTLQEEQIISKKPLSGKAPLFENKIWLWLAIILTITLLGWFSIKMMKSK